jgi:alpha-amylase
LGKWYHDQTDFDGVRLDAVKHISPDFIKNGSHFAFQHRQRYFCSEYWAGELPLLQAYIDSTEGCMSLFDSSLHHNLHDASKNPDYDLREIFNETLVFLILIKP